MGTRRPVKNKGSNFLSNNVYREIQTSKNPFVVVIGTLDTDSHIQLWDIMLHQETISLNILHKSRLHPHLSAYTHIYGGFYHNRTFLALPGTRVFIENISKDRVSWAPHIEPSCYIGPAMEPYRFHNSYTPKTIV